MAQQGKHHLVVERETAKQKHCAPADFGNHHDDQVGSREIDRGWVSELYDLQLGCTAVRAVSCAACLSIHVTDPTVKNGFTIITLPRTDSQVGTLVRM